MNYMQKYYRKHKERIKKQSHDNYVENRARKYKLHKIWIQNNKELVKLWRHNYYLTHKKYYQESNRKYYLTHRRNKV